MSPLIGWQAPLGLIICSCIAQLGVSLPGDDEHVDGYPRYYETYMGYLDGKKGHRLKDAFDEMIPLSGREAMRVLVIGCGRGDLGYRLHADGFGQIHNIDENPTSVDIQKERFTALGLSESVSSEVMDLFSYGDAAAYNVIVEKGVLELYEEGFEQYLPKAWNILDHGGLFIHIGPFAPKASNENGWSLSGFAPSNWLEDEVDGWKLEHIAVLDNSFKWVEVPDNFYVYFLRKQLPSKKDL